MTEAELRSKVVTWAHGAGWKVFSLPIAKTRRPVKDAVGYPDLTLARRKSVIWIELKGDGGTMSDAQRAWQGELPECFLITPEDLRNGVLVRLLA